MNEIVRLPLQEPDIEAIVLGSLIMQPETLRLIGSDLDPRWFTDPGVRMFVDAALRQHELGHRVTPPLLLANTSPDYDSEPGLRARLIASACAQAVPTTMLSGMIETLRDRWARREVAGHCEMAARQVRVSEQSPFELATEVVAAMDNINSARSRRVAGPLSEALDEVVDALDRPDEGRGATTGILSLDRKINGYVRGHLYVVAGRPGMGKSAFMCSSLRRTAAAGHGVAIFSLEMPEREIAARCLADTMESVSAPPFGSILNRHVSDADRYRLERAAAELAALPIHIDASPRLTFSEIAGRARQVAAKYEAQGLRLDVLAVDHMGLVTPSERYRGNKVAEAGEVSNLCRALAKELDCCVVLLSQLSRQVEQREDKRPVMSDLRWSGEIEQDAHVLMFVYREHYYLQQEQKQDPDDMLRTKNRIEVLIRKNRNGQTADLPLWCSIAHSSVRDL